MDNEKHVDESWKNSVKKDEAGDSCCSSGDCSSGGCGEGCSSEGCGSDCGSEDDCGCGQDHGGEMKVSFLNYIMSMGYQAMIFVGEIPNPMTGKQEVNLRQAKFLIDTLGLLKEKTKGNLNPQEENMLTASLYELQMKYVDAVNKGKIEL
jgi:hypothetical protein